VKKGHEREVGVWPEKLICVLLTYEVNLWGKGGNCVCWSTILVYGVWKSHPWKIVPWVQKG